MNLFKTCFIKIYGTAAFMLLLSASYGQKINKDWQQQLNNTLQQFVQCDNPDGDCYKYIGESLNEVYEVNDFYSKQEGRYMLPAEIADFVGANKQWTLLGHAYEKETLSKAQDYANASKATVAVYKSPEGQGHVAIILPGDLQASGSWGIKVPNTASFFLGEPEKSYVSKGLSYAFRKNMIKDVLIYGRNY